MQPSERPCVLYGVDAGGSRTIVTVLRPDGQTSRWERDSFAIATAGPTEAVRRLGALLDEISDAAGDGVPAVGCIGSSAMPVGDEAPPPETLIDAIREHAPAGWAVLVNDVVPLLWSHHLRGVGLAVSSGTGSSVIGRGVGERLLKVGGHEYIISDEGSAYSLSREGLRCAVRDADGIGEATSLRLAAETFFGRPMAAMGRWLAEMPRARRTVASFAPAVTAAADAGDLVAQHIVATEADRLVESVQFAAGQLGLPPMSPIGLAGGVFFGSALFRDRVESTLNRRGLTDATRGNIALLDGLKAALGFAAITAERVLSDEKLTAPTGLLLEIQG
jgi:N-acetylglucosamine kinase-like BadF-type ATPase